jgi:hypothetical protein
MDLQAANPSPRPPHTPSLPYALDLMNLTLFPFLQVSIAALLLLLQGLLFYMYPDLVLPIHFRMHQTHTQAQRICNRSHLILPPYDTNFYGGVLEYYVSEIYVVRMFSLNPRVDAHLQMTPNTHTKVASHVLHKLM